MPQFKLGLLINPFAGIGGALALKGSDGAEIRQKALEMGAEKKANDKTRLALQALQDCHDRIRIYTAAEEMGADLARDMGFDTEVVYTPPALQTEGRDTEDAARQLVQQDIDFLLFAGGDGTARNICSVVGQQLPVLGVPAGCKIHSGVYAITPKAAGRLVAMIVQGEAVSLNEAEVRDIDESLFRQGRVQARHWGEMQVPSELRYVQAVKMGGKESEELVLNDIAAHVAEMMRELPERLFVMGSGSTVGAVMEEMGLDNTLLGVDIVKDSSVLAADVTSSELLASLEPGNTTLVITLIGGQGHILGRGNQQLSPEVIKLIGRENILLLASKGKLADLQHRPLVVDSGDHELDLALSGLIPVTCGYRDQVLYPVAPPVE